VKEYGKRSKDLHINKRGVGWELPASRLGFLNPGKKPLTPFLIADCMDSRGDPDDVAEKISLVVPRVELSNRSFSKFLRDL